MINLITLCGIPASGKTTLAEYISENINAKIYSDDDIYSSYNSSNLSEITAKYHEAIRNDLLDGFNVVCDGTYLTSFVRKRLLNSVDDISCKKILINIQTKLSDCIERNKQRSGRKRVSDSVIYTFAKIYETPTLDEGWDEIILY